MRGTRGSPGPATRRSGHRWGLALINWAEVTAVITLTVGAGGIIYQAGRLTRKVQDLGDRVASIERWIRDHPRR
jgi:hypothetical protein